MATGICPEAFIEIRSSQPFLIPGLSLEILVVRRLEEERRRKKRVIKESDHLFTLSNVACPRSIRIVRVRYMQNHHCDD